MEKTLLVSLLVGTTILFSGCTQNQPIEQSLDNQPPPVQQADYQGAKEIEQPVKQPITEKDESEIAKRILVSFFDNLSSGKFEEAANMGDPSEEDDAFWWQIAIYGGTQEKPKMLEDYCEATKTCLKAKVLEVKQVANYEYNLVLQFLNEDGSIYIFGPCCGASEEEMPSKDQFDFKVKKINNEFKVATAPLYRP